MAHEISIRKNGFAEMAFAGELPWHRLGNKVDENSSIETWQKQAGLDWSVEQATVQFKAAGDDGLRSMADRVVLYRSDTRAPLSVVSDGYKPVQPGEILEFFRDLTESHGFKIHTAGVLHGGRKIWALAKNGHTEEISKGDKVRGNLLLATACDGTMTTQAMWTAIRVVCANTLAMAVDGNRQAIKTSHRTTFKPDEVKAELGALDVAFTTFAKQVQELARKEISRIQALNILTQVFPTTKRPDVEAFDAAQIEKDAHRNVRMVLNLFDGAGLGAQHAGSKNTAWGLVNAVTQFIDHSAGRNDDTRMNSAWFGRGSEIKTNALQLAIAA